MVGEVRAEWSTPGGGAGQSVFHTAAILNQASAQAVTTAFYDFFYELDDNLPDEVSITMSSEVVNLDAFGVLTDVYPVTPPAPVIGLSAGGYNRAAGGRVDWNTGVITNGRRLKGRTYIVPINASAFDANGLLVPSTRQRFQTASDDLIAALSAITVPLHVWSRTHGISAPVTSATIPLTGAILRGRRD